MPAAKLTRAQIEQVKTTAIATGSLLEAATRHGITHAHARMLASRGKWPVGQRVHKQAAAAEITAQNAVVTRNKAAVALVTPTAATAISASIADNKAASQAALHLIARRSLEKVAKSRKSLPVKTMRDLKDAAAIVEPKDSGTPGLTLNLAVFTGNVG